MSSSEAGGRFIDMTRDIQPEWRTEHLIRSYDVDPGCTARLPVLCKYMQEAAYHHAEHLGVGHTHLSPLNMGWVLSRMRIEVNRLPKWGETVKLRTWPSGRDRLFYNRDFEITDGGGEIILQASTAWFVIDVNRRERLIPEWWQTAEYPFGSKVFSRKLERLKACGCSSGEPVTVNYGDLDQNGHVNNVRYIEWILNSLPLEFHQQRRIRSVEVNYLSEAVYGHAISVCEKGDELTLDHSIRADGEDLFRARSVWETVQ